jgi:hypothetical protein
MSLILEEFIIKVKKDKFIQFLPDILVNISNYKTIEFVGIKLKTAYLIDITHQLLMKYYFKGVNLYNINSSVLKERYGYQYNIYIKWLELNNILIMVKNYNRGRSSRLYKINDDILKSKIHRYTNIDKVLLKKWNNRYVRNELCKVNIEENIKVKLIEDLYLIKINKKLSYKYIDLFKFNINVWNRNKYSVDSISKSDIFYHFDDYGRFHTNFTILKSWIRKNCLYIDGEKTFELDIPNSQPLFLYKLMKEIDSKWVKEDELRKFRNLVLSGTFYDYITTELKLKSKKETKKIIYKVIFGRNLKSSKWDNKFKELFPTIHFFITLYKKENGDYKFLSHKLQKMESDFVFNLLIPSLINIKPDIKLFTVHDSISVKISDKDLLINVFKDNWMEYFIYNKNN